MHNSQLPSGAALLDNLEIPSEGSVMTLSCLYKFMSTATSGSLHFALSCMISRCT